MDQKLEQVLGGLAEKTYFDMLISGARKKSASDTEKEPVTKVKVRPVSKKQEVGFQIEEYCGKQVFHRNCVEKNCFLHLIRNYPGSSDRQKSIRIRRISTSFLEKEAL